MIIGNITNNIINIAIIVITSIKSKKDMLTRRTGGSLGIMRLVMAMVMLVNIKVILKFKIKIILITQALCFCKYLVDEEEKKLANNKKKKKVLGAGLGAPLSASTSVATVHSCKRN